MKILICIIGCFFLTQHAHAYVPHLITQPSLIDITPIPDPELSQVFFGELMGFPHTYEIRMDKEFVLTIGVHTPDLPSNTNSVSAIIIKEAKRGRVEEIVRLQGKDATWQREEDWLTGGNYRKGTSFEAELDPGVYRIEIHTPNNTEKYMFAIGIHDEMSIGYIELLKRIARLEHFFERPTVLMIESPYVYTPIVLIISLTGIVWCIRKRVLLRELYYTYVHKV